MSEPACYHGADECPDKCMCPCDLCYLVRTDTYTGDALDLLAEDLIASQSSPGAS